MIQSGEVYERHKLHFLKSLKDNKGLRKTTDHYLKRQATKGEQNPYF